MYVPCVAGKRMIVATEKGDILPCEILNHRLGNLKDYDYNVRNLLSNDQTRRTVEWIRKSRCHCTFECALATSIIFHPLSYPILAWRAIKAWMRRRPKTQMPASEPLELPELVPSRAGPSSANASALQAVYDGEPA
jgi:radical SAM protein with 4Fe4S-binding SPASM domain